ncbi:uncharacterized protein LOC124167804 isoform X2 [Ischnura elegans]|uniref:uncharacterized protein LOC124167804 isoform X2 n=1 Tax=Ischnura elegans TaxID=197161 RepID=UPI001ED8BB13|nr:uncharacterized protein LOC124167804 isoform X2 [Ischnura elegans]
MDHYYQDIPPTQRNFSYPGPRPRSIPMPHPAAHYENFNRFPIVGENAPAPYPRSYSNHYNRYRHDTSRYQKHPYPLNISRNNYNPFGFYGNHSRANFHPVHNNHQGRFPLDNQFCDINNVFPSDFWQFRNHEDVQSSQHNFLSKESEPSQQDKQKEAEAIKKANLAAKLKKSLDDFKKNPSYKKKNLSIISKTDKNRSSKHSSEIQPCFRWDLPLTVDDLKTIRRCPTRSECDDQSSLPDEGRITEGIERPFDNEPASSSPDIIYVKRCRKRKLSESVESSQPKRRLFENRRRHRSASPKLCLENATITIDEQSHFTPSPNRTRRVREESSHSIGSSGSPSRTDKSFQGSNVMKLLGVKRREFDELVNHPRSPRVQFMLGLLMKRHKELLLQRAMRSRISNASNPEEQRDSEVEPSVDHGINTSDVINGPVKLEGMGASDTIDQLSNILLESSLAVDISNLPQELIDQLSSILELGADSSTSHDGAGVPVDSESNFLIGENHDQEPLESSGIITDNLTNSEGHLSSSNPNSDADIPGMSRIHFNKTSQSPLIDRAVNSFRQEGQSNIMIKRETLHADETLGNIHFKTPVIRRFKRSDCVRKSPEQRHRASDRECNSIGDRHISQNTALNVGHSLSTDVTDCDSTQTEDQIMMKIYSIDAKIFELTQEKKLLWEKLWNKKGLMCYSSELDDSIAKVVKSNNISSVPEFENVPLLKSCSSVNTSENSLAHSSCVQSGSSIMDSRDDAHHSPSTSDSSTSSKDTHKSISAVDSEVSHLPNSPNLNVASGSQKHETKGKRTKVRSSQCSSISGQVDYEVRKTKSSTSIDVNVVDEKSKNSSHTAVDSAPCHEPKSVETDPDIVEILDEPLEILYDSNDPEKNKEITEGEITDHKDSVLKIKAVANYLFICCADHCVYCYDLESFELLQTYKGHEAMVTCFFVDIMANKMNLYTGSHDKCLRCFSIEEGTLKWVKKLEDPIQCMIFRWGCLFLGTKKGKIEKYKMRNAQFTKGLSSLENEIMAIQASKEGPRQVLIVAPRNIPMVVRDANSGLLLRTIGEDLVQHTTYSLYESRGLLYAGTSTLGVKVFDFTSGEVLQTYTGCGSIVAVKVSAERLYAASYDGKIYIYDLKNPSPAHIIDASDRLLLSMEKKGNKAYNNFAEISSAVAK